MEREANACIKAGCRGACCINTFIVDRRDRVKASFPNAVEVAPADMPGLGDYAKGVYFCESPSSASPDGVFVLVQGHCPNLTPMGSCAIYESPMRPSACANLQQGSLDCNEARHEMNLPPIMPLEPEAVSS